MSLPFSVITGPEWLYAEFAAQTIGCNVDWGLSRTQLPKRSITSSRLPAHGCIVVEDQEQVDKIIRNRGRGWKGVLKVI